MAHNFKVDVCPAKNKDGSDSKRKKIYTVTDRHRKHRIDLGETTTLEGVETIKQEARDQAFKTHLAKHPNDTAFKKKHGLL